MSPSLHIDELTTVQVGDLIRAGWTTVIVPLGATEQHGPALPLLVDNEHGLQTAMRAARLIGRTLVGPVMTLGHSPEHTHFAGTVSLAKATVAGIIHDIAESHARSGFRLVYFWIAHGGNHSILQEMLPILENKWPGCRVTGLRDIGEYISATWDRVPLREGIPLARSGSHAGEFETSIMLAARPELVRMDRAEAGNPAPFDSICEQMMRDGMEAVSSNGVLGDQRGADAGRGNIYLDALAEYLAAGIRRERGS
ncbi:MAG: creatininase family protein [Terrimicrobiaceae bacterium]|nr:creatininase family protein [Terrimicrobiaceae bacterium]